MNATITIERYGVEYTVELSDIVDIAEVFRAAGDAIEQATGLGGGTVREAMGRAANYPDYFDAEIELDDGLTVWLHDIQVAGQYEGTYLFVLRGGTSITQDDSYLYDQYMRWVKRGV